MILTSSCRSIFSGPNPPTCNSTLTGFISAPTSQMLTKNYRDNLKNNPTVNGDIIETESQSVWFSYKEITEYLCVLQNEYANQKDLNLEELGIRVYFGRYPDLENLDQITFHDLIDVQNARTVQQTGLTQESKVSYSNKHCIFFVPTYKDSKDGITYYNQDFLIEDRDQPSKTLGKRILLIGKNKNHGGLAPPENVEGAEYLEHEVELPTAQ